MIKLSNIKPNPNNPRVIKDEKYKLLVKSLREFPEMMAFRPIVVDENWVSLGGNQRLKALQEIYGKEGDIPDEWVSMADNWSEDRKQEFVFKDNISFGEWDLGMLNKWKKFDLAQWGLDLQKKIKEMTEDEFQQTFNNIKNNDALYPIVPKFDEKHEVFIIVSDSEVDANFLREKLAMNKMRSYKRGKVSKSNIIHIKDVITALNGKSSNPES